LLLATVRHEERIADLAHLLARSPDGRARALLLEALEALLPVDEAKRLMPLLEHDAVQTCAEDSARLLGRKLPTFEEAAREAIVDRDLLTRRFLTATLDPDLLRRIEVANGLAIGPDLQHHRSLRVAREDSMLKRVDIVLQLRTLDLFARLTTRELSNVAAVIREKTYSPGAAIVREGEFGDCMYVVV